MVVQGSCPATKWRPICGAAERIRSDSSSLNSTTTEQTDHYYRGSGAFEHQWCGAGEKEYIESAWGLIIRLMTRFLFDHREGPENSRWQNLLADLCPSSEW